MAKELQRQELEKEKRRRREVERRKQEILASSGAGAEGGAVGGGGRQGDAPDGTVNDLVSCVMTEALNEGHTTVSTVHV